MPFIKINDGSVHLTARDALWMDHPNFSSAQRSLLNSSINGAQCNGPPIYTQTPHQTDFYVDGQMLHRDTSAHMLGTADRAQSPNHYHYAALTASGASNLSTFYSGHQVMVSFSCFFILHFLHPIYRTVILNSCKILNCFRSLYHDWVWLTDQ